jgi:hypothetical protein
MTVKIYEVNISFWAKKHDFFVPYKREFIVTVIVETYSILAVFDI